MAKGGYRGGFPGGGNQMNMMKQAQKMQQEFMKMQQELESTDFEFTAGGGAVKAVVSGTRQFSAMQILNRSLRVMRSAISLYHSLIVAARTPDSRESFACVHRLSPRRVESLIRIIIGSLRKKIYHRFVRLA